MVSGQPLNVSHLLVRQFLEQCGYKSTLAAFSQEANSVLDAANEDDSCSQKPLIQIVDEEITRQKRANEDPRAVDHELDVPGDGQFPRHLYESFTQIHTMNILTVRTQVLPVTNFVDGEYSKGNMTSIVTGSADRSTRLTSLLTGEPYNSLDIHSGGVPSVDFHPEYPTLMLTASLDATAILVDTSTSEKIQVFKGDHTKPISRARFSPDGSMFVTASLDRTICFYQIQQSPKTPKTPITPATPRSPLSATFDCVHYAKVHTMRFSGKPEAICFLPDNQYLVVGVRDDNYLHYVDLSSFEETLYNMNENGDDFVSFTAMDVSASPHNQGRYLLVSTDRNGRLILFRTHSSEQLRNFYGVPSDELFTPRHCWHSSGKYFFINDGDNCSVSVFDVAEGRMCASLHGHTSVVRDLWYDAEKDLLLTCGYDKTVRVWGSEEVPKTPTIIEGSR